MVASPKIAPRYSKTKTAKRLYTPEEYFAIDECFERRLEYVEGEIIAMAGESHEHNKAAGNVCLQPAYSVSR